MSRRALSANAGAPLIEPRMHCRRNSVGDQCEWPGYLPAAKHQIDSRVSSAPASAPAYLQRRPLHAAAGLPPPWPCSGPAAVLPQQSQRAGTGSAERLVLRDHARCAACRLGRAHTGGQGRFPGTSTFEVGLFGWMAIVQLVLFRASHPATDAAAF